jgi:hypothetical protein
MPPPKHAACGSRVKWHRRPAWLSWSPVVPNRTQPSGRVKFGTPHQRATIWPSISFAIYKFYIRVAMCSTTEQYPAP